MGVSITAYTQLRKRADVIAGEDYAIDPETKEELPHLWRAYCNPDFPGREDWIENRAYYEYEKCVDGMDRSYGGYNVWRNDLAKLAGWKASAELETDSKRSHTASAWAATEGPFWELINFADNEGVIGGKVCAKLAKDFAEYQAKADAHPDHFFREGYNGMRRAFEAAAETGAVDFS
jgi:hypothetical protein